MLYQHLWERGNKINNKAEKEKKFFLKIVKSNTKLSKKKVELRRLQQCMK